MSYETYRYNTSFEIMDKSENKLKKELKELELKCINLEIENSKKELVLKNIKQVFDDNTFYEVGTFKPFHHLRQSDINKILNFINELSKGIK